ncbi:Lrp/AsnC family transcriptional regulator [Candidatus Woesearchaeota archaeon]|nr:Lrp/AsnC family transcriptional regulator [Candidatus Woesearchaeota archaeon]
MPGAPATLQKLEQHRFLVQYRPVVNYAALGLTVNALLVKLNYSAKVAAAFETMLRSTDAILWATKTFGEYDYLMYVLTKDVEEFHEMINRMKRQFEDSIKTYEVLSAFEELKYFFMAESVVPEKR